MPVFALFYLQNGTKTGVFRRDVQLRLFLPGETSETACVHFCAQAAHEQTFSDMQLRVWYCQAVLTAAPRTPAQASKSWHF